MEARNQKLHGASDIHRFNRDVEEALSRIQEKYTSIPEDLGRDLKQVQAYQKSHEAFENELVALEAQVRFTFNKEKKDKFHSKFTHIFLIMMYVEINVP